MGYSSTLIPLLAFALGSIPFGWILYRWRAGGDIRAQGSGNIGATNVLRTAGRGLGIATLALDAAKGFIAVGVALHFAGHHLTADQVGVRWNVVAGALVLVVLGHVFTPWLRFHGGKGVATALGAFLALAPVAMLGAMVVFLIVITATRFVSLASVAASAALPLVILMVNGHAFPPVIYAAAVALAALVILRHSANLRRLLAHTEPRLGQQRRAA